MNGMVAALVKKLRPSNGPPQPSSKSVDGVDLGGGWKECIDTRPGAPSYGRTFSSTLPRLSPRGAVRQHGETGTLLMDIPLVCHGGRCLTNLGKHEIINKSFHFF